MMIVSGGPSSPKPVVHCPTSVEEMPIADCRDETLSSGNDCNRTNVVEAAVAEVNGRFRHWNPNEAQLGYARAVGREVLRQLGINPDATGENNLERLVKAARLIGYSPTMVSCCDLVRALEPFAEVGK